MAAADQLYLTFNAELPESATLSAHLANIEKEESEVLADSHPLQYKWKVWEQVVQQQTHDRGGGNYSDATKEIAEFDTVEEFWNLWTGLPQPSKLLQGRRLIRQIGDDKQQYVDAIMIFKNGVKPEWEDPRNANGGHLEYKLKPNTIRQAQLDECWNNLVLSLIGGTLQPIENVTGVRLVDKLSPAHRQNTGNQSGNIRLEIWFSESSTEKQQQLNKSVEAALGSKLDGTSSTFNGKADFKPHKSHK
eukprot:GHVN01105071.1.p1 GENE.GHVN01105071.1~~GHVN01105071.1.p1  ORF type:complete len:247 (+),score=45.39 GHVN01105071.1:43-783(+)